MGLKKTARCCICGQAKKMAKISREQRFLLDHLARKLRKTEELPQSICETHCRRTRKLLATGSEAAE